MMQTRSIHVGIDPIFLSLIATIAACLVAPSVTGKEYRKIEPITKHLFTLQDKQIKVSKQKPNIGEQIRGYNNQDWILNQGKSDNKLTIHRIPTNTPQRVITSNRSPRDHCIEIQRERNPSSYYLRTRRSTKNYSGIIGGEPMEVVNPIRDGVQIGSGGSGLCGGWN